jgi:hypothetical protein
MLEHARQVMPHLRYLRVTLEYIPYCPHEDPAVTAVRQAFP